MKELEKENLLLNTACKIGSVFRDKHLLCGLNPPELFACHIVRKGEIEGRPTRAKDLAEAMEISKPAVSKLLNAMEDKDLLRRERREEDRKAVYLVLTEKAHALLEEQKATAALLTERIAAEMGKEKAREMTRLVDLFYESYKKAEATLWED